MKKKTDSLSCIQVQHSIKEYLHNQMTLKEADAFVNHVRNCRECRNELEEYYAFSSALVQLDDTANDMEKGNFFLNVEKLLEKTESQVLKEKKDHRKRRLVYALIVFLVAAAMGVGFGI